jgi:cell fate (sporulation/competence/biofilm development) regulator YlbF (YheA/YmcA/DUF963 family)
MLCKKITKFKKVKEHHDWHTKDGQGYEAKELNAVQKMAKSMKVKNTMLHTRWPSWWR